LINVSLQESASENNFKPKLKALEKLEHQVIQMRCYENNSTLFKIYLDHIRTYMVMIFLLDENLLIHINQELAGNAGRASDPP
jgi:hypothetical protein